MRKLIVLPTYNERNNIKKLVNKINNLKISNLDILVIDDNSPDKTSEIIKEIKKSYDNVHLIIREEKLGLGTAYIRGFKWGIKRKYDVIVEMDADFSHDPKYLPEFFNKINHYDFVIGSRYVRGGGVKNWPFSRRAISKLGSLYSRVVLGVKIKDFTGGFNAWKLSALKKINLDNIKSNGYSFQIEMKYRAAISGFSFFEFPIVFKERENGKSKMSREIFLEAIWKVWWFNLSNVNEKWKSLKKSNKFFYTALFFFFVFLVIFRLHNVLAYNPYWGYDGGAHIDYILSIAKNKMPDPNSNYLAWHEPLYYALFGILLKFFLFFKNHADPDIILKYLGVWQACLSILTTAVIYKLIRLLSVSKLIIFSSIVLISLSPSLNQASTFLTNELLSYFFIFIVIYYLFKQFLFKKKSKLKYFAILGLLIGLGLLTKITFLIILILILFYFLWRIIKNRDIKILKGLLLMLLMIFIINLPWQIYRKQNILDSFSINNTEFAKPQPLKIDERLFFFGFFDKDIFIFPYWYSGGRSFWSMLYADTFYDYYGTIENKNYINYLLNYDKEKLIKTTHLSTYVSKRNYSITIVLVWLAIILLIVFIIGFINNAVRFLKKRKALDYFYFSIPLSFLIGLMYYSYRYPYYDQGIVKAIFIFPSSLFLAISGLKAINNFSKKILYFFIPFIFIYSLLIVISYWVIKFNY
ncbi:MAG: polyprenol monophosphomannose synthase [Patescibacteria group bacterium]